MYFERVLKQLNAAKVRYLVIGGVAVNLHGYPRVTGDLDLMISLDARNVKAFITLVKKIKWVPRIPVDLDDFASPEKRDLWIRSKGMRVFSVLNPKSDHEHMDVMVVKHIDFDAAYKRRIVSLAGRTEVTVAGIPDLLRLKEISGRERDKVDIRALRTIQRMRDAEKKKD